MDHNHLLWDDTVAGPKPDRNIPAGRKKNMFQHLNNYGSGSSSSSSFSSSPSILSRSAPPPLSTLTLDPVDIVVPVVITRSITILKPNSSSSATAITTSVSHDSSSSSVPSSPAAGYSSSPSSPFSPRTPQFDSKGGMTTKKKSSVVHEPRTPTVYDWVVISALDR